MKDMAITLVQAAIKVARSQNEKPLRSSIIMAVATELMHETGCSEGSAIFESAKALAEVEATPGDYIMPSLCTMYGITLSIDGKSAFIGIQQLREMIEASRNANLQTESPTLH